MKTVVRYEDSYSCSTYYKDVQYQEGRPCTCHYINEANLEQLVLEDLRDIIAFISRQEKQFVRLVLDKGKQEQARDATSKKRADACHEFACSL